MNHPINPILLVDVLVETEDEREHIEPQLRAVEQDPTSNVTIQRFQSPSSSPPKTNCNSKQPASASCR